MCTFLSLLFSGQLLLRDLIPHLKLKNRKFAGGFQVLCCECVTGRAT